MIGKTISHYKILEKLGEGGMGIVYKAQDTKLKRTVALKFLSPHVLGSDEEKDRFVREAQAAAALSHPNICTVYEIDEVGEQTFIAMEYIKGQSLKEKIESGPLKLDDVKDIGIQLAEGLHEAHSKGIVHRDIKSANIMLTENKRVKIMDFGLAKLSGKTQLTKTGTTLGTFSYMSPEQTKGESVDHSTDVWSVGVVLYEMITGQLPFKGDYEQAITYSILNEEPDHITALRSGIPMAIERIVNKLLAKDPADRYQHINELSVDLKAVDRAASNTAQIIKKSESGKDIRRTYIKKSALLWTIIIPIVVITSAITFLTTLLLKPKPKTRLMSFSHHLQANEQLKFRVVISPDGSKIVYVAESEGIKRLYLRPIDQLSATVIPNTEGAFSPIFSPDGRQVCFQSEGKLKTVLIEGGVTAAICDVNFFIGGVKWPEENTIILADYDSGLVRVSPSGSVYEILAGPNSNRVGSYFRRPEILPGSKALLYTAWEGNTYNEANIALLNLDTGVSETLIRGGTNPLYSPTGHIVFGRMSSIWAVPFDLKKLRIIGQEEKIVEGVSIWGGGGGQFNFSENGTLVYVPIVKNREQRTLVLTDFNGVETPLTEKKSMYDHPNISPNGKWIAFVLFNEGKNSIWLHDVANDRQRLLTLREFNSYYPNWTDDSKKVSFVSDRTGIANIYLKSIDSNENAKQLSPSNKPQLGGSWSADGTLFAFYVIQSDTNRDIWIYSAENDSTFPFLIQSYNEHSPAISPDGQWIAYTTDRSGRNEIWLASITKPLREEQVSSNGGVGALWSADSRKIYYREADRMMVVAVETKPDLMSGKPEVLFEYVNYIEGDYIPEYDIHPDSKRFLLIKEKPANLNQLNIILNWFEDLKRLAPVNSKK